MRGRVDVRGLDPRDALLPILDRAAAGAEADAGTETALEEGLDRLIELMGAQRGVILVKDPTTGVLDGRWRGGGGADEGAAVVSADRRPALAAALAAGRLLVAAADDEASGELTDLDADCVALVPLRARGETIGALGLCRTEGGLDQEEEAAVVAAGRILALVLRNAQLFAGLQERARDLDRQVRELVALSEVTRAVSSTLDEAAVQRTVVAHALRLVRADAAALLQPDGAGGLAPTAAQGLRDGEREAAAGAAARALASGVSRAVEGNLACLPLLRVAPRPPLGALVLARRGGEPFSPEELERLVGLVDQAVVALGNAELLSELRREQAERRALAAALVEAQEQERRRIAEEIHDGPIQEMVGLSLLLDAIATDLARGDAAGVAPELISAARASRDAVGRLRRAIVDLHPIALEELGLAAATRSVSRRLEEGGAVVEVDLDQAETLPPLALTVAFRVVQEALENVGRHAAARRVSVTARRADDRVEIMVVDDGRGFDPPAVRQRLTEGHLGLPVMRKRASLAGGWLRVESAPGKGTTVLMSFPAPLDQERAGGREAGLSPPAGAGGRGPAEGPPRPGSEARP
jgi:signal transduction histidine kinase